MLTAAVIFGLIVFGLLIQNFHGPTVYTDARAVCRLSGQFTLKRSTAYLPCRVGKNSYEIHVDQGSMRINHVRMHPENGTKSLMFQGKKTCDDIHAGGKKRITIMIDSNDCVQAVNRKMFTPSQFTYKWFQAAS